jgi:hypothetical protein
VRRFGVLILCALALPVGTARAWTWPVEGLVARGFSFDHDHPYAAGQHRGIDVLALIGENVLAPATGIVSFAGTVPSGGKTISIQTPSGTTVTLLHLGSIAVRRGSRVDEASVVGTAGASADPELPEPHVYLGIRRTEDPQGYLDPLTFLPARTTTASPSAEPVPVEQSSGSMPADPAPAADPVPAESIGSPAADPEPAVEPAPDERSASEGPSLRSRGLGIQSRAVETSRGEAPGVTTRPAPARLRAAGGGEHAGTTGRPVPSRPAGDPVPATAPEAANATPHDPVRTHVAAEADAVERNGESHVIWWPGVLLATVAVGCGAALLRRRGRANAARMMDHPQPESALARSEAEERPRRAGLAVCGGSETPRTRGGVRRARGHLRALPPAEGESGADGERHGRARDTGDGHGGPRRRLAA